MDFTYTERTVRAPVHSAHAWKGHRSGERHCKSDPQTLILDVHGAASTVWLPLYITHWKSTLRAASAPHAVPKKGGSAARPDQQQNASLML